MTKTEFKIRKFWFQKLRGFLLLLFEQTVWGKATAHLGFEGYLNTHLFKVHSRRFGSYVAIEMMRNFNFERCKIKALKRNFLKIFFLPYSVLAEYEEKNYSLKVRVKI